ncbi:MAG: hypothetical protein ACI93R_003623 [Flavobacteriales bacterium]|jgi:hypothetical protein
MTKLIVTSHSVFPRVLTLFILSNRRQNRQTKSTINIPPVRPLPPEFDDPQGENDSAVITICSIINPSGSTNVPVPVSGIGKGYCSHHHRRQE